MVKNLPTKAGDMSLISGSGRSSLEKGMGAHSDILAWKFHGQGSLMGYSP